jgi:hypothetical protein
LAVAALAIAALQQLALMCLAELFRSFAGQDALATLAAAGGADYVYSHLLMSMLGSAVPAGLAIARPLADALQPAGVNGGAASLPFGSAAGILFAARSSAVGVQLMETMINLAFAAAGMALLTATWPAVRAGQTPQGMSHWAGIAGLLAMASAVGAQIQLSWTGGSPGGMALSMIATKLLGMDSARYDASLGQGAWASPAINLAGLALAAGVGAGLGGVAAWLRWRWRAPQAPAPPARADWRSAALIATAALLLISPLAHGAAFQDEAGSVRQDAAATSEVTQRLSMPAGPRVVTTSNEGGTFVYQVDGTPQFIRGIGYNAVTKGQSEQQRIERYSRDFAAIRAMGANTITGWDQSEFDDILMQQAAEHGLGVILPLHLDPGWDYGDPASRQQILDGLTDRVERFRDSPALRIWGLGNEVIHDLVDKRHANAAAFAGFLVRAADHVRALDPRHPVVYRDAEDVYLQPVAQALRSDGVDRPWFIYGMNFFTTRLESALARGQARSLGQPLLISEFGPVGLRGIGRAAVYSQLWKIISANRGLVIGGCAYVWTTEGPEPLDRTFGLTDARGAPVDSSLSTLAALFGSDESHDAAGQ